MMTTDDMSLLRAYARDHSEKAFETLVERHLNLVHSVALRHVRDPHLAQEVTQAAFIILARKAATLRPGTILAAWLCRTAQFAAADALKTQRRRQLREQSSFMESTMNAEGADLGADSETWTEVASHLDSAMNELSQKEHGAIVLRYFQGKDLKTVGAALGITEHAAKTRVWRALEKLRRILHKRGVTVSSLALGAAVAAHSVQAAPIGLAASVTTAAVQSTHVTASTLTLIKSTLKIMAWTKFKTAVGAGVIALATVGVAITFAQSKPSEKPALGGQSLASRSQTVEPGFGTPEKAFQSFVLALSTGNLERIVAACTAERGEKFKQAASSKSDAEMRRELSNWGKNMAGFKIIDRDAVSETEVRLMVEVQPYPGHPNVGNDRQVIRKVGDDWKYAGKWGVDIKE